jgi:hypothetical protein
MKTSKDGFKITKPIFCDNKRNWPWISTGQFINFGFWFRIDGYRPFNQKINTLYALTSPVEKEYPTLNKENVKLFKVL